MKDAADLNWTRDRALPSFQAPQQLDVYDVRSVPQDVQLAISTFTGIINRPQPHIYLIIGAEDEFWLDRLPADLPRQRVTATGEAMVDTLLDHYRDLLHGLVIYDPAMIDTINVATMIAAQQNGMVVSPGLAERLQGTRQLPILSDLRSYKWRTRLHVYRWAEQNLLRSCSQRLVAGLNPTIVTGLRSYLVATRTFIYWLDSRSYLPDVPPGSSSNQPLSWLASLAQAAGQGFVSERALMQRILQRFSARTTHLGWFIDEGSGVSLTSEAAIPVLASDVFANLEVWTALQTPTPNTAEKLATVQRVQSPQNKIYLSFTISDGDNLQYCQRHLQRLWNDPARGSLPIGWTISPVLGEAAPTLARYYQSTATSNDEFIAGPSGAGYMFPSRWPDEQLSAYLTRTGTLMQAMNLSVLEILDGNFLISSGLPFVSRVQLSGMVLTNSYRQQDLVTALQPYGLQGVLNGGGVPFPSWKRVGGIPFYRNLGIAGSIDSALFLIREARFLHPTRPLFLSLYVLAWSMTPTLLKQLVERLGDEYEVVLPGTLLAMLANSQTGHL